MSVPGDREINTTGVDRCKPVGNVSELLGSFSERCLNFIVVFFFIFLLYFVLFGILMLISIQSKCSRLLRDASISQ